MEIGGNMEDDYKKLKKLLREAALKHHTYEQNELNGKYDEMWADWYAEFLINNGIEELIDEKLNKNELKEILNEVTEKFKQSDYKQDWGDFVAQILLE